MVATPVVVSDAKTSTTKGNSPATKQNVDFKKSIYHVAPKTRVPPERVRPEINGRGGVEQSQMKNNNAL